MIKLVQTTDSFGEAVLAGFVDRSEALDHNNIRTNQLAISIYLTMHTRVDPKLDDAQH